MASFISNTEGLLCRAYVRVSTEEQAQHGFSLDAQEERLGQFARSQGWNIAKLYREEGASAKDLKRPKLQEMLAEVQPGEVILVYKLDRLTRSVADLHALLQTFEQRQLLFKSATETFDTTTSNGRLMITLVAALAQWERETISDRAAEGIRKKAADGEWGGGPVPFGLQAVEWEIDGRKQISKGRILLQLVKDPQLAHIVDEMFARYLAGHGVRSICNWLNDERAVRTVNGNKWQATSVVRVLTNPLYCGLIIHGRRSKRQGIEVTTQRAINVEPIIPTDTWEQVQSLFNTRKGMAPRQATGNWPLAGVARCGICGKALTLSPTQEAGRRYYRCLGYVKALCGGKGKGKSLTSVPAHLVEEKVVELIHNLHRPDHLDDLFTRFEAEVQRQYGVTTAERKRIQIDMADAKMAIKQWDGLYEKKKLSDDEYLEKTEPHKARLKILQEQLAELKQMPAPPPREELASFAINLPLAWEHLTPPERKTMLLQFLQAFDLRVVVYPGGHVDLLPGCIPFDSSALPVPNPELEPVLQ